MNTSQAIDTQAQSTAHGQIALQAKQPSAETERRKDYCKKLCMVIARYATDDELSALVQTLESFKSSVLEGRYAPGLNDAAYDLYTNFHLRHLADAKNKNAPVVEG